MKPLLLLALIPLVLVSSCTSLKTKKEEDQAAADTATATGKTPTSARSEDVAKVKTFFDNGGKHGFHPPAGQTPALTAENTAFVVELDQQRVYLYHQGELIAASRISSGRPGYRTETGSYTIGQKNLNHRSNLYGSYVSTSGRTVAGDVRAGSDPQPEGAKFVGSLMKYFQRFERAGSPTALGFHQGVVPTHPASHGCIRLPAKMADWFFAHTPKGTPVQINGTKYGVKPGTRQKPTRRAPRSFIPAKKSEPAASAPLTTGAEAEGGSNATPAAADPATPASEPAAAPATTTPAPPAETTPAPAENTAEPAAPTPPAAPAPEPAAAPAQTTPAEPFAGN